MSTVIYHNHHIIPKYRCKEIGINPDFPENIIRLTRIEHAVVHYHRWLKNGRREDLGAAVILAKGEIDGLDTSGESNPFYGKKHSAESRKKISVSQMGKTHSAESRKKISENNVGFRGKKHSVETRKKIIENHVGMNGKKHSAETRKNMSESNIGENNSMYGKKHSLETKKKISETLKERAKKKKT